MKSFLLSAVDKHVSTKQSIEPKGCSTVTLFSCLTSIWEIWEAIVLEIRQADAIQLVPVAACVSWQVLGVKYLDVIVPPFSGFDREQILVLPFHLHPPIPFEHPQ